MITVASRFFGPQVILETDHHDITEILLKVALNTIKPKNQSKKPLIKNLYLFLNIIVKRRGV
jgi:hypothetical protein